MMKIETLNGHLKPITSDACIRRLLSKGFYGRQWLFEAVEKWRSAGLRPGSANNKPSAGSEIGAPGSESRLQAAPDRVNAKLQTPDRASRLFWIMGAPGVGKSAFATIVAQIFNLPCRRVILGRALEKDSALDRDTAQRNAIPRYSRLKIRATSSGDTVIAAQFCESDRPDHRNAPRIWCEHSCLGNAPASGAVVGAPPATLEHPKNSQCANRPDDSKSTGEGAGRNTRGACAPRKLLLTPPEIAELDRKDAAEPFDYLLANPLRSVINGCRERYRIVVDALDEAGEAGRNPLMEMLARNAQRIDAWTMNFTKG